MKEYFEEKERRGLPGGPNEMFTYVTGVFSSDAPMSDIFQARSDIEGDGMFAGRSFKQGELIGLAHKGGQPATQLGKMHNHNEESPTMISKKIGDQRFVYALKDLKEGEELTTNYRMQPELEQPEQFQQGGTISQAPSTFDNIKSDLRSFVRYPFATIKEKFNTGNVPYNFDKGIDSGQVDKDSFTSAIDFFNPINAAYKSADSLDDGDYSSAAMNALSILPIAKPLKAIKGVTPIQAKLAAKAINKGSKASQLQEGGTVLGRNSLDSSWTTEEGEGRLTPVIDVDIIKEQLFKLAEGQGDGTYLGKDINKAQITNPKILYDQGIPYVEYNFGDDEVHEWPLQWFNQQRTKVKPASSLESSGITPINGSNSIEASQINVPRIPTSYEAIISPDENMANPSPSWMSKEMKVKGDEKRMQELLKMYGNSRSRDIQINPMYKQDGGGVNAIQRSNPKTSFLYDIEKVINASLGSVNDRAQAFAENPGEENSIDNMRHAAGGRYAAEAIQQKVRDLPYVGGLLDSVGVDKAAGFIGSNLLGVGHELRTILGGDERPFLAKLQEMGEDTFNNYVGSIVGSLDIDDSKKDEVIKYLSYNNLLPDGYVRTKQGEIEGLSENVYFKDEDGNVKRPEYKKGGSVSWKWKGKSYSGTLIPSMENEKNRYARTKNGKIKTLPKAQDGGSTSNPHTIYKHYINGNYKTKQEEIVGQKVYDKLNRVYYRDAKAMNMSPANYIMTYVAGNS